MAASETVDIKVGADTGDARRSIAELGTGVERLAESIGGEIGAKAGEAAGRLRALGQQEGLLRKFSAFARRSQEHGAWVQPPSHARSRTG